MKILVVDDELPICELLYEFLSQYGFQVNTATSGEEAISLFSKEKHHVVLLDVKMPDMDGIEVLKVLREIDDQTEVIMISAFADEETKRDALRRGASLYLEKPVELERLKNILGKFSECTTC